MNTPPRVASAESTLYIVDAYAKRPLNCGCRHTPCKSDSKFGLIPHKAEARKQGEFFSYRPPPLETQIARALKCQPAAVSLRKQPVFRVANLEFHPIATGYLKRSIVSSGCRKMVHIVRMVMMVVAYIRSLCDNG